MKLLTTLMTAVLMTMALTANAQTQQTALPELKEVPEALRYNIERAIFEQITKQGIECQTPKDFMQPQMYSGQKRFYAAESADSLTIIVAHLYSGRSYNFAIHTAADKKTIIAMEAYQLKNTYHNNGTLTNPQSSYDYDMVPGSVVSCKITSMK